jgi:Putative Flp pilus-assembly TadE/G-like
VAVDYSFASFQRTELQKAADAAALAAAKLPIGTDVKAVEEEAKLLFQGNDGTRVNPAVLVTAETVTVEATYAQSTFLMRVFGHQLVQITARAVAARGGPKPPCVLTLEKLEKEALFANSASKLNTDCGVQVNSTDSEALRMNSGSSINADWTCVAGGWTVGGASVYQPAPKKCPAFPDPLANLPTPAEATGPCTKEDYKIDKGTATLSPGVYCKNLLIDNGAVVTLNPGIYVIRDGPLKINSGSTLTAR